MFNNNNNAQLQINPDILAWKSVCQKLFNSILIQEIIAAILFLVLNIINLILADAEFLTIFVLLSNLYFTISTIFLIWMLISKRLFLNSPKIDIYSIQILHNCMYKTNSELITKQYIFSPVNILMPIDLSKVYWIYRHKNSSKYVPLSHNSIPETYTIVMRMQNNKKRTIQLTPNCSESEIFKLIKELNPNVIIGESSVNKEKYNAMLKADKN